MKYFDQRTPKMYQYYRTTIWLVVLMTFSGYCYAQSTDSDADIDLLNVAPKTVVAILRTDTTSDIDKPWGTGILFYSYEDTPNILVTNRHIFEADLPSGKKDTLKSIQIKTNIAASTMQKVPGWSNKWFSFDLKLVSGDTILWTAHPDPTVDIAVVYFPPNDSLHMTMGALSDCLYMPKSLTLPFEELECGQNVMFLGFPLGLGAEQQPVPIMRFGAVSSIDETKRSFLIDAQVFGGSSGSPVFATGYSKFKSGAELSSKLIGIVNGFKGARLRFKQVSSADDSLLSDAVVIPFENSGLGTVFSVDLIYETIVEHHKAHSSRARSSMK